MASIKRTCEVPGKSPSEVYEIAVEVFKACGCNVWHECPITFLVMVRTSVDGFGIEGNLAARVATPTRYTLTLTSSAMEDEALGRVAEKFIKSLTANL